MRRLYFLAMVIGACLGVAQALPVAGDGSSYIHEIEFSSNRSGPSVIQADRDGTVWVALARVAKVARITRDGAIREFSLPAGSFPVGIARDKTGHLYISDIRRNVIVQLDTATGAVRDFSIPTQNAWPFFVSMSSDGRVWFTERASIRMGSTPFQSARPSTNVCPRRRRRPCRPRSTGRPGCARARAGRTARRRRRPSSPRARCPTRARRRTAPSPPGGGAGVGLRQPLLFGVVRGHGGESPSESGGGSTGGQAGAPRTVLGVELGGRAFGGVVLLAVGRSAPVVHAGVVDGALRVVETGVRDGGGDEGIVQVRRGRTGAVRCAHVAQAGAGGELEGAERSTRQESDARSVRRSSAGDVCGRAARDCRSRSDHLPGRGSGGRDRSRGRACGSRGSSRSAHSYAPGRRAGAAGRAGRRGSVTRRRGRFHARRR